MADREEYHFVVEAEDPAAAGRAAQALADTLREAEGVLDATRGKAGDSTMDLGAIVAVVASSGATLAVARGIASWLRARRGVSLRIEREGQAGKVKASVDGIDPETAVRILEAVQKS